MATRTWLSGRLARLWGIACARRQRNLSPLESESRSEPEQFANDTVAVRRLTEPLLGGGLEAPVCVPVEDESETRTCQVCFEKPINTVALPCRHSLMCDECMTEVRRRDGRCPLCRAHIDLVRFGEFDADFVSFAHEIVERAVQRLERTAGNVYEGMYEHIKVLLFIGLVSAAGSIAFFFMQLRLLSLVMAAVAFHVGYVPWFTVTMNKFENLDLQAGSGHAIFSREDCNRPHVLLMKVIFVILLLPLVLLLFLFPYALVVFIIRPFACHLLPCWIECVLRVLLDVFYFSWMGVTSTVRAWAAFVEASCRFIYSLLEKCWQCACFVYRITLVPLGNGIRVLGLMAYKHLFVRVGRAIRTFVLVPIGVSLRWFYHQVLYRAALRIWTCFSVIGRSVVRSLAKVITTLYFRILLPLGQGLRRLAVAIGRAIAGCTRVCAGAVAKTAEIFYLRVLLPLSHCLAKCVLACVTAVTSAMKAIYLHALLPLMQCLRSIVLLVATVLCQHILTPLGRCTYLCASRLTSCFCWCASKCMQCLADVAAMLFAYVLQPIGCLLKVIAFGVCLAVRSVAHGTFFLVRAFYVHMLKPVGVSIAAAAKSFYSSVLAPVARATVVVVSSIAQAVARTVHDSFDCMARLGKDVLRSFAGTH